MKRTKADSEALEEKEVVNMKINILHHWLRFCGKEWFALGNGINGKPNYYEGVRIYWLNPWKQDENNYGWFTFWELFLWGLNSGPVPRQTEKE